MEHAPQGYKGYPAQANESGSVVELAARGLKLDELEVASLRGEVQEASLQLDLGSRLGRGAWSVQVQTLFACMLRAHHMQHLSSLSLQSDADGGGHGQLAP